MWSNRAARGRRARQVCHASTCPAGPGGLANPNSNPNPYPGARSAAVKRQAGGTQLGGACVWQGRALARPGSTTEGSRALLAFQLALHALQL